MQTYPSRVDLGDLRHEFETDADQEAQPSIHEQASRAGEDANVDAVKRTFKESFVTLVRPELQAERKLTRNNQVVPVTSTQGFSRIPDEAIANGRNFADPGAQRANQIS